MSLLIMLPFAFVPLARAQGGAPSAFPSAPELSKARAAHAAVAREGNGAPVSPAVPPATVTGLSPGLARLALGLAGAAAIGLAALFYFLGDSVSPDFPVVQLGAVGVIALAGVGTGALAAATFSKDETQQLRMPAARPVVSLVLWPTANAVIGNARPFTTGISFDPAFAVGARLQFEPHLGFSFLAGNRVDVDPRPQLAATSARFPVAMTQSFLRFDLAFESALRLGPLNARGLSPVEVRFRHAIDLRREALQPAASAAITSYTLIALPLLVGLRWNISARQGFTVLAGPRIDFISSAAGRVPLTASAALLGAIYAEAWYFIDLLEHTIAGKLVSWRLTLGYQHIRAYNAGFSAGASIGFFGPLQGALDLRFPITARTLAGQIGVGAWVGDGGGAVVRLGLDFGGLR